MSIDITPGEVTALLGPNGAGKSSLVLTVGGALRATSGHMWLGDQDFATASPRRSAPRASPWCPRGGGCCAI